MYYGVVWCCAMLLLIVRKLPIIKQRCFHFKFKEQLEVGDVIEEQKADVCVLEVLEWLGIG